MDSLNYSTAILRLNHVTLTPLHPMNRRVIDLNQKPADAALRKAPKSLRGIAVFKLQTETPSRKRSPYSPFSSMLAAAIVMRPVLRSSS